MTNIYIGNLAYSTTEDTIRAAFEAFGEVSKVSLIIDRETNRSRGFAFVEMPDADHAREAIVGLNLQDLDGRRIAVNEARPKE